MESIIAGWQKVSTVDYPGQICTVLFTQGCNMRCPYCHNPDLIKRNNGSVPFAAIENYLRQRSKLISAITITGGEPTIHTYKLMDLIKRLKKLNVNIKLDTNGMRPDIIKYCNPDYLALDIKTVPRLYRPCLKYSRNDSEKKLIESILYAKLMEKKSEIRITCVRPIVSVNFIKEIAHYLNGIHTVYLQRYNHIKNDVGLDCPSEEELIQYKEILSQYVYYIKIRGKIKQENLITNY